MSWRRRSSSCTACVRFRVNLSILRADGPQLLGHGIKGEARQKKKPDSQFILSVLRDLVIKVAEEPSRVLPQGPNGDGETCFGLEQTPATDRESSIT